MLTLDRVLEELSEQLEATTVLTLDDVVEAVDESPLEPPSPFNEVTKPLPQRWRMRPTVAVGMPWIRAQVW